jgi:hypothetical protein
MTALRPGAAAVKATTGATPHKRIYGSLRSALTRSLCPGGTRAAPQLHVGPPDSEKKLPKKVT